MLSSRANFYHMGQNVIIWDKMLSAETSVVIWNEMLSSRANFYHLGQNVIIWDEMLSSGASVVIWS
jgi:hypothetical protein